ncbi:MAG: hypothetical protein ACTSUL_03955 [Promethearchaeota archaeon]
MVNKEQVEGKPRIFKKAKVVIDYILTKTMDKPFDRIFKIIGWSIISFCIYYWIYFFIIVKIFEPLLYTTYITSILIGLTLITGLKSTFFNSFTSITFYGFLNVTLFMIPLVDDIFSLIVGPVLHGAIAGFQLFLILHKKAPICTRFLLIGMLFYLTFMSSYDSFHRFNIITGLERLVPTSFTVAYSFYALIFSVVAIYFYKKKYGIIVEN